MLWGGWWLEGLLVWEVRSTTGMKLNGYMCWCCTADVWWWPKGLFVFLLAARASALINLSVHTRDPCNLQMPPRHLHRIRQIQPQDEHRPGSTSL